MQKILKCVAFALLYAGVLALINAPIHTIEVVPAKAATATTTASTTPYKTLPSKVVKQHKRYTSIAPKNQAGPSREAEVRAYFSDIPFMAEISRCESGFVHLKFDGTVLHGRVDPRDTGVMQINAGYHYDDAVNMGLDIGKFEDNMKFARHLYRIQGTAPWSASAKCWDI